MSSPSKPYIYILQIGLLVALYILYFELQKYCTGDLKIGGRRRTVQYADDLVVLSPLVKEDEELQNMTDKLMETVNVEISNEKLGQHQGQKHRALLYYEINS